jgi:outer membrane protein OmpU
MKKSLLIGLLISLSCGKAFSQSSVTLYGSIDDGVTYVNNAGGHSSIGLKDGISQPNGLGFTGTEDLGDGMSAIFKLQDTFSANTGAALQGGLLFGNQAYLGLTNSDVGQITLGRQFDYTVLLEQYMPCLSCGIYSVENADIDRASAEQLNDSIAAQSVSFGGLKFGAMYAFGQGESASSTNAGRAISADIQYNQGPFSAIAVLTDINGAPFSAGWLGAPTVLGTPVQASTILFVDNQRIAAVGASYKFGAWTPSLTYSNTQLKYGGVTSTDQLVRVGTTYFATPSVLLAVQLSADRFEDSRWYTVNCGVDYFLSKQTDVYIDLAAQRATGAGTVASIFLAGDPSSTSSQFLARIGFKHRF